MAPNRPKSEKRQDDKRASEGDGEMSRWIWEGMEHGAWSMEQGARSKEQWSIEHGAWSMEHGCRHGDMTPLHTETQRHWDGR